MQTILSVRFYRSDHAAVFDLSMDSDDDVLLDWEAYAGAPQQGPHDCRSHATLPFSCCQDAAAGEQHRLV